MRKNVYQRAAVERRRAKSYILSLEKSKKQLKGVGKRAVSKKIREVQKAVQRSYRGSGYSIERATAELRELVGEPGKSGRARINRVFQQQIGLASRGEKSSLGTGEMGRFKSKAFYRATQRMWEGVPPERRNEVIMRKMGVSSLSEAYDLVMKNESVQRAVSNFREALESGQDVNAVIDDFEASPSELAEISSII